jgi:predicted oxidoreductase
MGKLMDPRTLNGSSISPIALGTMRFAEKDLQVDQLENLIASLFGQGINIHHSSFEYGSYPLYCAAISSFKKKQKPE